MVVPTFWFSTQFYIVFGISILGWKAGGGHILFMVSCEGKHKVLLILKRGSGIFHKTFPLFTTNPPEIKNDNSLNQLTFMECGVLQRALMVNTFHVMRKWKNYTLTPMEIICRTNKIGFESVLEVRVPICPARYENLPYPYFDSKY